MAVESIGAVRLVIGLTVAVLFLVGNMAFWLYAMARDSAAREAWQSQAWTEHQEWLGIVESVETDDDETGE
jgi:hypothetical protein